MNPAERESLVRLYEDRYRELGYDVRTLGWKSVEDQLLRFQVLCDIGDLSGLYVCDVGCGFADMSDYLRARFGHVKYTGTDISASLVDHAKRLRPECDVRYVDILDPSFDTRADYFLLSGALNYKLDDNLGFTEKMLRRMFSLADKGVGVNFLSSYVNYTHPRNYHHRPEDMLALGKAITPWVTIRHDYPLWEFTLFLYRDSRKLHETKP